MAEVRLIHGKCEVVLPTLATGSVDAVVCDPPAGISFMGAEWDRFGGRGNASAKADRDAANQGPGAGLGNQPFSYFGSALGTRKQRDAFIAFITGVFVEVLRIAKPGAVALVWALPRTSHWTATALEDAGWLIEDRIAHLFGQGFPKHHSKLKPACEDWWLCRKPGPKWLGVEECRIPVAAGDYASGGENNTIAFRGKLATSTARTEQHPNGRWPANVVHDGGEEVLELFAAAGEKGSGPGRHTRGKRASKVCYGFNQHEETPIGYTDSGSAARFFYCSKASKSDRGEGNTHPTVKSTSLMRWLVKLACPPDGVCLDPFAGSGTTGLAALQEGRSAVLIEQDAGYVKIARKRLAEAKAKAA